jgi:hypothetical protein
VVGLKPGYFIHALKGVAMKKRNLKSVAMKRESLKKPSK